MLMAHFLCILKPSDCVTNSAHATLDLAIFSTDHYLQFLGGSQIKEVAVRAWQSVVIERATSITLQMGHEISL